MASESQTAAAEMQSFLERLITSRNRDLSLFIPFLLGFTDPPHTRVESRQTTTDPDHNSGNEPDPDDQNNRDRIVLINPLTQGMVVIEGTGFEFDSLFRNKGGQPPASKSAIEGMPSVEIKEGEEVECVICLEKCEGDGVVVKEMPCKHRFHEGCIEKWLNIHGSCPVCRFKMPVEEEEEGKKEERGRGQREIWVSFSFGRRRTDEETESSVNDEDSSDNQGQ